MTTCKECLHEKACVEMLEAMGYKVGTDYKGNADRCDTYTPKSQYAEVKHGKWLINSDGYYPYCSECKTEPKSGVMSKHCPECGAVMEGSK